jgi:hypothetical protein
MKNENKSKSPRRFPFNAFDVAPILLVALCIVGVFQRNNLQQAFEKNEALEAYTVTFEVRQIRSTAAELLVQGIELYLTDGDERVSLGTLSGPFNAVPATVYLQDKDGNTVKAVYPEDDHERLQDGTGTLNCRGIEHEGSFLLEGKTYLSVNQMLTAYTENGDFEIRITGIHKVG